MTNITRRRAIGTGTLTAIVAGLLGAAGAVPAAVGAQTLPAPLSATVSLCTWPSTISAEWMADWKARHDEAAADYQNAWDAALERTGPDGWKVLDRLTSSLTHASVVDDALTIELLCIHLPGIAPAIRVVYQHLIETAPSDHQDCCG